MNCFALSWLHLLQAVISAVMAWTLYGWVSGMLYVVMLGGWILIVTMTLMLFAGVSRDE